ncbi:protein kinase [Streptomyces sp. NPDC096057]|uniref:serine/threonine-protein kinase n=1 Tax=Streptomyces sp. NPDC096057 TaxID=3155543 RepID=UPI003326876E
MEKLGAADPQRIGAYRLVARLGAGGMGQVYLARSDRGRTVAVKLVREDLAAQEEFRARFRQEVRAARRVGGHWTAPVLDADTEAAVPWVATGYVAGPTLQQVVGRDHGALPERSVRILAAGLAHALQDIHAAGIVHRDLKPSNVLVTIDGPRVIDFGIARALETLAGDGLTRTGSLVGSPGFMAPEQVRGDRITPACDVFCLGSVLAYAATGTLPFGTAGSGVHALMFRIAQEEPDLSGVPEGIADLVRDCLRKDPATRPTLHHILDRTGADDTVSDGRSRDPWLPNTLVAQLGRHAVKLLDTEDPETAERERVPPTATAPAPGSEEPTRESAGRESAGRVGAASVGAGPESAGREGAGREGAASVGAGPESAGRESAGPVGAGLEGAASKGAGREGVGLESAALEGAGQVGAGLEGAASGGAGPVGAGPEGAAFEGVGPEDADPEGAGLVRAGSEGVGSGRPDSERPGSGSASPGRVSPEGQAPETRSPGEQIPAAQIPTGQNPGGQIPAGQDPGGQIPTGQNPGGQIPAAQNPGGQIPAAQHPGGQIPTAQNPGGQNPALRNPEAHGAAAAEETVPTVPSIPPATPVTLEKPETPLRETPTPASAEASPEHAPASDDSSPTPTAPDNPLPTAVADGTGTPRTPNPPAPHPAYGSPQQHPQPTAYNPPPPPAAYGYPQEPPARQLVGWGGQVPYNPYPHNHDVGLGPTPPYGPGRGGEPQAPRNGRSTALLVVVALIVALGAGGSVYALMKDGGNGSRTKAGSGGGPATGTAPTTPGPSTGEPSASPSPSATPTGDGAVPAGYLGTWNASIDNDTGHNTRQLTIRQGKVGDPVLTLVADGPGYHCEFSADLAQEPGGESPLAIGASTVTSGQPRSSCNPGAATEITLLSDRTLQRVNTSTGEKLTYTRSG